MRKAGRAQRRTRARCEWDGYCLCMLHAWCRRAGCLVHNGTGRRDGRTRCVGKAINAPKVLGIVNGAIEEALAQPDVVSVDAAAVRAHRCTRHALDAPGDDELLGSGRDAHRGEAGGVVVGQALGDRIPSTGALTETMRRRRASGGPAEQTFATLVGLELRPRKVREASDMWRKLFEAAEKSGTSGITVRDGVWAHPDLMPDADDLDNPAGFIDRVIGGGDESLDDAIAELEKSLADEAGDTTDTTVSDNPDDPPTRP